MLVKRILKIVLLLLAVTYVFFQTMSLEFEGALTSAVIMVLLTILYVGWTPNVSKLFLSFLVLYALAEVINVSAWSKPEVALENIDCIYFSINTLYLIAYTLLIVEIIRQLDFKTVFKELTIPIIILLVLDVFSVTLISNTTEGFFNFYEYALEYTYNAVVMLLLSLALINYMYRNTNKSMLFLIGSIFIVFSEIIQLSYYYILKDDNLGFIYSLFFMIALTFFYLQSQQEFSGPIQDYTDENYSID